MLIFCRRGPQWMAPALLAMALLLMAPLQGLAQPPGLEIVGAGGRQLAQALRDAIPPKVMGARIASRNGDEVIITAGDDKKVKKGMMGLIYASGDITINSEMLCAKVNSQGNNCDWSTPPASGPIAPSSNSESAATPETAPRVQPSSASIGLM